MIDLAHGRFYFFFIELWPQEVYYITGLLILAAFTLFLMNAVAGRIWCGYLCPQTVWTDLFMAVERLIEGDRRARLKLDAAPWSADKFGQARFQACDLARDRLVDRRRLGALLCRCADPRLATRHLPGAERRLRVDRDPDLHDLYARRAHARAGLHLHVPVAAHPGRPHRRAFAGDHLPLDRGEPRGSAKKNATLRAQGLAGRRLRRLRSNASPPARPASTSATASRWSVSNAGCAPTPATRVMQKLGRPTGLIAYDTDANVARRMRGDAARLSRIVRASNGALRHPHRRRRPCHAGRPGAAQLHGPERAARPQPDLRHSRRRLDPQRLHAPDPQQAPGRAQLHGLGRRSPGRAARGRRRDGGGRQRRRNGRPGRDARDSRPRLRAGRREARKIDSRHLPHRRFRLGRSPRRRTIYFKAP